jgi:hypothetical protein
MERTPEPLQSNVAVSAEMAKPIPTPYKLQHSFVLDERYIYYFLLPRTKVQEDFSQTKQLRMKENYC